MYIATKQNVYTHAMPKRSKLNILKDEYPIPNIKTEYNNFIILRILIFLSIKRGSSAKEKQ